MADISRVNKVRRRRLTRRTVLRGSAVAAAAVGVTPLSGCAMGNSPPPPTSAAPQPTTAAAPATPSAKLGGTLKVSTQTETPHLDLHQTTSLVLPVLAPG